MRMPVSEYELELEALPELAGEYESEEFIGRFLEPPMLDSRRFARQEILIEHRLVFRPNAPRAAKVRYTRLCADSGAGEKDDGLRSAQAPGKFIEIHRRSLSGSSVYFLAGSAGLPGSVAGPDFPGAAGVAVGAGWISTTLMSKTRVFPAIG